MVSGAACSVVDAATRAPFEQTPPEDGNLDGFAQCEYAHIESSAERRKELMVVVVRGRGIDYQETRTRYI